MKTELIIITVVIFILGYLMQRYYNKYKHYQALSKQEYKEYTNFKEGYNFLSTFTKGLESTKIKCISNIYLSKVVNLRTLMKDIPIDDEQRANLKNVLGDDFEMLMENRLGFAFLYIAKKEGLYD